MTPAQRQRVEDLFDRLADQALADSSSVLESECPDDPLVRAEVLRLLNASKGTSAPMTDVRRGLEEISAAFDAELPPGERVENYELLENIASGGMGTVYRARQDLTNQIVALKVIRPGLLSPHLVRRFMFEVEVLGKLEHVGIARIFGAGIAQTSLGQQPYFAMEFVHGLPLDKHAKEHQLTVRERLALFHLVAEAMNAAHARGVIHRDLKPNNILVTESGQPKILDFGVARATNADQPAGPALTIDTDGLIGTLPFMAPEQITSQTGEIDLETDVYALGVVGFLLLTGQMPYDVSGKPIHDISYTICELEPRRPGSIDRALRGDVEAILLKALEKQKSNRYRSAGALAEDLRRALNDEPIQARPIGAWTRAAKFAKRNRLIVATVGAVILSLAAGLIATGFALRRAERERAIAVQQRARAESESEKAVSVLHFFTDDVLGKADPLESRGREVTVVEAVDNAAATIGTQFAGKPLVEAGVRQSIGKTYNTLSKPKQAMPHLRRALELLGSVTPDNASAVLDSELEIGRSHALLGEYEQSEKIYRNQISERRVRFGPDHRDTLQAENELAALLIDLNRFAEAISVLQSVCDRTAKVNGRDNAATFTSFINLYGAQQKLDQDARTLPKLKELLDRAKRVLPQDHPVTLDANRLMGVIYGENGESEKALECMRADYGACKRVYGPDHGSTAFSGANLVAALFVNNRYSEAAEVGREVVEHAIRALGPTHPMTLRAKTNLAASLGQSGQAEEGERLARQTMEERSTAEGADSDGARVSWVVLGICLREQGKYAEAEKLFQRSYEKVRDERGLLHPATLGQMMNPVDMAVRQNAWDRVIAYLSPYADAAADHKNPLGRRREQIAFTLAEAYEKTGQPEKVKETLARIGATTIPTKAEPGSTAKKPTNSPSTQP